MNSEKNTGDKKRRVGKSCETVPWHVSMPLGTHSQIGTGQNSLRVWSMLISDANRTSFIIPVSPIYRNSYK